MMNHIALTGPDNDTVANYLVEKYGFKKYSFMAVLRRIAEDLFEVKIDETKDMMHDGFDVDTPKTLMIKLKAAIEHAVPFYSEDEFVSPFARKVMLEILRDKPEKFVISDYSYESEKPVVSLFKCMVIQIGSFKRIEPNLVVTNEEDLYKKIEELSR